MKSCFGSTSALRAHVSRLFLLTFLLASTAAHAAAPTVSIDQPADDLTFNEGETINFQGTASDPGEDGDLTAAINWSSDLDGPLAGPVGSFNISNLSVGTHTITASVTDSDDDSGLDSITVTINSLPTVTITAPADGSSSNFGASINFEAGATDDEDNNNPLTNGITWSSNLDGALAGTGGSINEDTLSIGVHTITASVTDSDGGSDSDSITVTITNNLPVVTITAPADFSSSNFGASINFQADATDVEDNDNALTNGITWSSNLDGALADTGGSINVDTLSVGVHTITASVTDSDGDSDSDSITVTITNNAPTVTILAPANGSGFASGTLINFAASVTDAEDDDTTLTGQIAWSSSLDGSIGGSGGSINVSTLSIGTHTITASVTDSDGGPGSDSIAVTITNNAPTVTILAPGNGSNFDFGTPINFAASATDAEDDDTTLTGQIAWSSDLDGALPGSGGAISVSTLSIGTHTITASVTDSDGGPGADSITVAIANNAPTVTITAPADGLNTVFGTDINFQATATDQEDGDLAASLAWSSNLDGPIGVGGSINVSDLSVGTHTIAASVTDSDGGPGLDSIGVTITNSAPVLSPIGPQNVVEDAPIGIPLSASDLDGQSLVFSSTPLPAFCAPLVDNGNGTGAINCSPGIGDAGDYPITVTVADSVPVTDDEQFTLTVVANEAPTVVDGTVQISGTLALGEALTGLYTYFDAEGDVEGVSTFRWLRDGVAIPGEVSTTYTVVAADIEAALVFEVTPVALTGAKQGLPVQSPERTVSNTAPSITGQVALETAEETGLVVTLADLTVVDADSTYPADFTISAQGGADYTQVPSSDNKSVTITPALDVTGTITVPVRVNDGFADSPSFDLIITVTAVNDVPVITGVVAPLSTPEDTSLTIVVTDLVIQDADNVPGDFTLALQDGLNYTRLDNTITPDANFNGQLTVPATVTDNDVVPATSAVFNLTVTVDSVNDLPSLVTPIDDQNAVENSPFNLNVSGNFTDDDGDTLTYLVSWVPAKPPSISFNGNTGVFSGTPREADANPPGPVYTATVTARDPSGDFATDAFDLTISLLGRANLALGMEVAPETGNPGDDLRWTLTARNPVGPVAGENVELVGSFVGAGLTVSAEGGANCTIQPTVNNVTDYVCQLGMLPVGGTNATVFTTSTSVVSEVVAFATAAGAQLVPIDPNEDDNSGFLAAAVGEAFSVGAVQILGNRNVLSVAAGDINGDGRADLVAGTSAGQSVQVFASDLPRESCQCPRDFVTSPISIPDNGANEGVALGDFDRDGNLDVVVANGGGQADMVYRNDGNGNFAPMATLGNTFAQAVAVGDFNNDGNPDIAVAAVGGNPVYLGDGNGGFSLHRTLGNANSLDVAVAEFDANARDDLVFANVGSASRVWTKNSGAGFSSADQLQIGDAVSVAAGFLNGDQRPDLVFGRVPNDIGDIPENPVMFNSGNGTFPNAPAHLLGISPTNDVHIGDVSGDGVADFVFVSASGVHQIWTASGLTYTLHREQIIDGGAVSGVLADLGFIANGDSGGIDFAMGGALGGGLGVYLNDGAGNLGRGDTEAPVITLSGPASVSIESGQTYVDSGATAVDNIDGDISTSIAVANTVNTRSVGTYTVTYSVSDFAGNAAASVIRTVSVTPSAGSGGGGGSVSYWTVLAMMAWFFISVVGSAQRRAVRLHSVNRNKGN